MENQNSIVLENEMSKDFLLIFNPLIAQLKNLNFYVKTNPSTKEGSSQNKIVLEKINNYANPNHFKKALRSSIDDSIKKLKSRLSYIPSSEQIKFLNDLIYDLEYFRDLIIKNEAVFQMSGRITTLKWTSTFIFKKRKHELTIDEIRKEGNDLINQIGEFFKVLIVLINDTIKLLFEMAPSNFQAQTQMHNNESMKYKLKTKLSVNELAYLFRILFKADIFEIKNKTEFYRFIASNFTTKKYADQLTVNSIKNKFTTPRLKEASFWKPRLKECSDHCQKDIEKIKGKNDRTPN